MGLCPYETLYEAQQRLRAEKAEQAFRNMKNVGDILRVDLNTMIRYRDTLKKALAAKEEELERLLSISEVDRLERELKTMTAARDQARASKGAVVIRVRNTTAQRDRLYGDLATARAELKGKSLALAQTTEELFTACKRAMDAERYAKTLVKALDDEVKAKGSHEERITTLEAIVRP